MHTRPRCTCRLVRYRDVAARNPKLLLQVSHARRSVLCEQFPPLRARLEVGVMVRWPYGEHMLWRMCARRLCVVRESRQRICVDRKCYIVAASAKCGANVHLAPIRNTQYPVCYYTINYSIIIIDACK